jgi:hypothetical protein
MSISKHNTSFGDIAVCIMALACGCFFYYENYNIFASVASPEKINYIIKLAASVFAVLTWWIFSLRNGIKRRVSFLAVTFIMWIAAEMYALSGMANNGKTVFFNTADFIDGIFISGIRVFCELFSVFGISYYSMLNIFIIIYVGFFGLGLTIGNNIKVKD